MQDLKMLDGLYVVNWDKRQGIKNGDKAGSAGAQPKTSAERQREYRERQRAGKQTDGRNATVTERYVTSNGSNAFKEKNRIDKIKNIKHPPISPQGDCEGDGDGDSSQTCHPQGNAQPDQRDETPQDEPGIEFLELREFFDREMRCEGPLAGFKEYKTLKKARDSTGMSCWPGVGVICDDILKRKGAHIWNPGYEIGLGRYLAEKTWLASIVSRASPAPAQATDAKSEGDRAAEKAWQSYQRLRAQGVVE